MARGYSRPRPPRRPCALNSAVRSGVYTGGAASDRRLRTSPRGRGSKDSHSWAGSHAALRQDEAKQRRLAEKVALVADGRVPQIVGVAHAGVDVIERRGQLRLVHHPLARGGPDPFGSDVLPLHEREICAPQTPVGKASEGRPIGEAVDDVGTLRQEPAPALALRESAGDTTQGPAR